MLIDNFEAYKSDKVLELEARNNIHLMFIKSHTSHLFQQENSYTFLILKTNVLVDNNVIRIIELNEISESISSDKRIKRIN